MDTKCFVCFIGLAQTYVADSVPEIREDISAFTSKSNTTTFKVELWQQFIEFYPRSVNSTHGKTTSNNSDEYFFMKIQ